MGSKISSFFGGSEDEKEKPAEEKNSEDENLDDLKEPTKPKTGTANSTDSASNLNSTSNGTNSTTVVKPVTLTVREEIAFSRVSLDFFEPTEESVADSKKKLEFIKEKERDIKNKAIAVNALETFVFDTKDKLTQEEFIACSTESEREAISAKLNEATEWMDEAGFEVGAKEYKEQLKTLKKVCKDVTFRLNEKKERPKKLDELKEVLNKSMGFLETIKNMTGGEDQPLTQVQVTTFAKLIDDTIEWEKKMIAEQAKAADNETPKLLSTDIQEKAENLKREVGYLVTKIKYFRPPTKKPEPKAPKSEKKSNATVVDDEGEKNNSDKTNEGDEKLGEETEEKATSTEEEQSTTEESKTSRCILRIEVFIVFVIFYF